MGQAVRLLVTTATDATAQGVAATGIEVGLPEVVRCPVSGHVTGYTRSQGIGLIALNDWYNRFKGTGLGWEH